MSDANEPQNGPTDQISDFQTDKPTKPGFFDLTGVLPRADLTETP
jgi:hypothetical protein